ncbi:MAG: immunoglobulin-like domain-containing protein, partial [Peptostreptococcaceae bacterium]
ITVEDTTTNPEPEKNEAPVLKGINDKTIKVGDNFDKMAGVSASDKEDGDLTDKINVLGNVDTSKAGKYILTYSVKDSKGLETVSKRTITVDETSLEGDTYNPTKVYLGGDTVIYKGEKYTAKWWVQGEDPDKSQAWEKEIKPNEDGTISYFDGMVCLGGELVSYNGNVYKAKWWTNSVPGTDGSWEIIK